MGFLLSNQDIDPDSLPALGDLIAEDRLRLAGPPLPVEEAAEEPVLVLARGFVYGEARGRGRSEEAARRSRQRAVERLEDCVKSNEDAQVAEVTRDFLLKTARPARREAVAEEFDRSVARIQELVQVRTLREQELALIEAIDAANADPPGDLRERRESRAPGPLELLAEYEAEHGHIQEVIGQRRARDHVKCRERLRKDYPHLSRRQLYAILAEPASRATWVVLGARYALSPERIRNILIEARKVSSR